MDIMRRHHTAFVIALAALFLGITGDLLLRWVPWGVNALLWTILFCAAACVVARARRQEPEEPVADDAGIRDDGPRLRLPVRRVPWFPPCCALLAAAGLVWRDADPLVALDVLLLLALLPMLALEARGVRLQAAGLAEVGAAIVFTGVQSIAGFPQLLGQDLSWSRMPRFGFRGAGVVLRGTLIAAPALVIFGALLGAADEDFARVLRELMVFDLSDAFLHVLVSLVIAAICAGFLRSLAFSGALPRLPRSGLLTLPAAETNFALALINLMFAVFVGVQFRYFFGAAPAQLAQYARRGFFELVWVVGLVLSMLLLLEWLVSKERGFALFRGLAVTQVALVFVIAVSAFRRMQLYRDEFGLTRLRFFTTAFMIWLAALLIWFVGSVLTGRRPRFAIGALASGMAVVVALHAINPDAIIVATNVERQRAGRRAFDFKYAMQLSDDATPVILRNADIAGPVLLHHVLHRQRPTGWRSWNVSRARAREAVRRLDARAKRGPY